MAPAGYMFTPPYYTGQTTRQGQGHRTAKPETKQPKFKFDPPSKRAQFGKGRVSGWSTVYVMMGGVGSLQALVTLVA